MISVSIVSHGQAALARRLVDDLGRHCAGDLELILTENIPEPAPVDGSRGSAGAKLIRNSTPRGFGANHNAAFRESSGDFFCVLNPDVRLSLNPFPALLQELDSPGVGVAAPLIVNSSGRPEDSGRRFHTPLSLLHKALRRGIHLDYPHEQSTFSPDWVAGMFMLFRREAFERVGGFDERYFLYYEDIDICARLRLAGYDVRAVRGVSAIHDAQRRSHRDLRHFGWHLSSVIRFFTSDSYARVMRRRTP